MDAFGQVSQLLTSLGQYGSLSASLNQLSVCSESKLLEADDVDDEPVGFLPMKPSTESLTLLKPLVTLELRLPELADLEKRLLVLAARPPLVLGLVSFR